MAIGYPVRMERDREAERREAWQTAYDDARDYLHAVAIGLELPDRDRIAACRALLSAGGDYIPAPPVPEVRTSESALEDALGKLLAARRAA